MTSAEKVAEITVDAIINRKSIVSIPRLYILGVKLFDLLPFWIQHFIRDFIIRESKFMLEKKE